MADRSKRPTAVPTPGPWRWDGSWLIATDGTRILLPQAPGVNGATDAIAASNAALIAAAPETARRLVEVAEERDLALAWADRMALNEKPASDPCPEYCPCHAHGGQICDQTDPCPWREKREAEARAEQAEAEVAVLRRVVADSQDAAGRPRADPPPAPTATGTEMPCPKCEGDGRCCSTCPEACIGCGGKGKVPQPEPARDGACPRCGGPTVVNAPGTDLEGVICSRCAVGILWCKCPRLPPAPTAPTAGADFGARVPVGIKCRYCHGHGFPHGLFPVIMAGDFVEAFCLPCYEVNLDDKRKVPRQPTGQEAALREVVP